MSKSAVSGVAYWMERWSEIEARLAARPRMLLALDFDAMVCAAGTKPDQLAFSESMESLLKKLGASNRITLAFLSERPLQESRAQIGIKNGFYAGNHGVEGWLPGLTAFAGRIAWSKGNAIRHILAKLDLTPADTIYVGDDEEAFNLLSEGLTFCIGKEVRDSTARYRLYNISEVPAFLFCILCDVTGMRLT
ncbi:MAG: hypothetical protein JWL90_3755 [Chthoniobacteraceae bacterium]|nr:hypothetical protein [Chthoniobacteraceae bacterium]